MGLFSSKKNKLKALLLGSPEERIKGIELLFRDSSLRQRIIRHIVHLGGNTEDAKDAYQNSFYAFQRNIVDGTYRGEGSPGNYLLGIAERCWKSMIKSAYQRKESLKVDAGGFDLPNKESTDQFFEAEDRKLLVKKLLGFVKERCRKILWLRANRFGMEEIARRLNMNSAETATVAAYRCSERLKEIVAEDPQLTDLIKTLM